ncbi:MAG TPA: sugar ABC transporter substrate-binding protein [Cyanobacteria bacterium UBA8803]|nr:sugar ABC transporter substrate-binding protein [Cyanobacteria bacterium UBA9273]HBL57532.1 sugar ABC transporter substrate-binding protein [Cyanobacteria bacterium UBA8803]
MARCLNQPMAGLALLAVMAAAVPAPSMAQVPTFSPEAPTGINTVPVKPPIVTPAEFNRLNAVPTEAAYTLGSGDRFRMDIFDVPEYSGEYQVLVDGTLNLPVIGSVKVVGLTIPQATEIISQRYARYVRRPLVTLSLLAARPLKIAVGGEVNRPGSYSVILNEGQQFPTVTEVIKLAGGITRSADVRQVRIRRRSTPVKLEVFNVDLWELLQISNLSQDIPLRDGDEIFIPTTTGIDPIESRQLATASFAADTTEPIKVAVVGEVVRPGPYSVTGASAGATTADLNRTSQGGVTREPPTVTQAIQVAGGITQLADIRQVQVRRTTRDGSQQVIDVNLWELLQNGDLAQDVILQEGDTIFVPTATALSASEATELASASFSAAIITVNVVGEVTKPGVVQVPANAPLNQALLAAGGFDNRRARKSSVQLIRLNANGTVDKRKVEVDFTAGVNDETNPPLRPNDVIVVDRSGFTSFTDTLGTVTRPLGDFFSIFNFFRLF